MNNIRQKSGFILLTNCPTPKNKEAKTITFINKIILYSLNIFFAFSMIPPILLYQKKEKKSPYFTTIFTIFLGIVIILTISFPSMKFLTFSISNALDSISSFDVSADTSTFPLTLPFT